MSRDGWHETAGLHKHVQYMCISTLQSDICYSTPSLSLLFFFFISVLIRMRTADIGKDEKLPTTSWKDAVILQVEAKIVWKRGEQHLSAG